MSLFNRSRQRFLFHLLLSVGIIRSFLGIPAKGLGQTRVQIPTETQRQGLTQAPIATPASKTATNPATPSTAGRPSVIIVIPDCDACDGCDGCDDCDDCDGCDSCDC